MEACRLGPYRLDEVIARSGAATVYRATDTGHGNCTVALKVFAPHLSADPGFRERFRHDAGLLAALRQPHVVPVHSYGVLDGCVYLDMRWVRGPSLAAALREGPLDPARARAVGEQVRAVQEDVRRAGLGERLIEPADILLSGTGGRREFVQVVGLGLGRPPVAGRPASPADALGPPAPPPARRRRTVAVTASVLAVVVAAVVGVVALRSAADTSTAPGLVATIAAPGAVDTATAELGGRPVLVVAQEDAVRTWGLGTGRESAPSIPVRARDIAPRSWTAGRLW